MKIAYVGNFSQSHCTEVHLANTLEELGHQVERLQENDTSTRRWLNGLAVGYGEADLFMYTRTWGETVTLEDLAHLRERKIPTVSYHLDLYVGLRRKYLHQGKALGDVLETDPFWRTDFVFTPDGDKESAKVFKKHDVKHYYMKPGVYKPECYMVTKNMASYRVIDVLFVGGGDRPGSPNGYGHPEWPYRDQLIGWLYDTYRNQFVKKGHPQETIRNAALNELYSDAIVTVGDSVCIDFKHEYYWSDRVYETLGRGGFLIHPYIKGLEEEFTDGENFVFYEYGNFEQLKEKIDYYLEHDAEREKIRKAGHEFVKANCTYHNRLTQMLDIITSAGAVPTPSPATSGIKINLGAGSEPTKDWINVDWVEQEGIDVIHNLLEFPWPFKDDVAKEIKAIDVLEHMPVFNKLNLSTPIKFVEECHRILQTGGKLFMTMPHWQSKNLWIDPTHVRGYDEKSFDYFDPDKDLGKWYGYYSDKKFRVSAVRTPNDNVEFTLIKREG